MTRHYSRDGERPFSAVELPACVRLPLARLADAAQREDLAGMQDAADELRRHIEDLDPVEISAAIVELIDLSLSVRP